MVQWIIDRAKEPSTYAGFAGIGAALGMSGQLWGAVGALLAAIAGVAAIVMKEKGAKE